MLIQIEAGKRATGLDDRETDDCFETEFTSRTNPHRGYITIIEGCDKFCAYCVVPFTRGKERSRTSDSVLAEARQMADLGYTEIQLLGQNVNSYKDPAGKKSFAELLAAVGESSRHSPRALHHVPSPRFRPRHRRCHRRRSLALRPRASAGTKRVRPRARRHAAALQPRAVSRADRLDEGGAPRDQHHQRHHRRLSGRDVKPTSKPHFHCSTKSEYDSVFGFKYSPRPNTPSLKLDDAIPDEEKVRRLAVLNERQRDIQKRRNQRHLGQILEVMVEGKNTARGQWIGRTSQNKVFNFTAPVGIAPGIGSYTLALATVCFPNSLVGEMVI